MQNNIENMLCRTRLISLHMMLPVTAVMLLLSGVFVDAAWPPAMAKPGCRDKCGNVTIPYPFGIMGGPSCYYNEWYSITCNNFTPSLSKFGFQVLKISMDLKQLVVDYQLSFNCTSGNLTWTSTDFTGSPYMVSINNVFSPVNCPATNLSNGGQNGTRIPVVLDWQDNGSSCSYEDDPYLCHCPLGFGGNPYLPNGCQHAPACDRCKGECLVDSDDYTQVTCIPSRARLFGVVIGLTVGFGSLFLVFGGYWIWRLLKRSKETKQRAQNFKRNGGLLLRQQISSTEGVVEKAKVFTVSELEVATDHFNQNRILGQGGQGTVYKGMLTDGKIIAVKKSKKVDETQLAPFINEVVILSQINHRNVVKLLGCCLETDVPLLVYEFIPNGTLSEHIHNPSEDFRISWPMRLQIASESAGAIAYLHASCSAPIYHRDIKSSNILLDEKYRAKVSDFGTSRTIMIDQTHLTTQVAGTFGYLDPEYFQSNQFTDKSDVYSFGIVLVELLTSRRPISQDEFKEWRSLATQFLHLMENSQLLDILDGQILKEGKMEEFLVVANLAKECLNMSGKQRPSMKQVATVLEGLRSENGDSSTQQTLPELIQLSADVTEIELAPSFSTTFSSLLDDTV